MKKIYIDGTEIEFGEKPSWVKRFFISIKDLVIFNYKTLSPGWKIAFSIIVLISILNILFRRDFSSIGWAAPFASVLILVLPYLKDVVIGMYDGKTRIIKDSSALLKIKNLKLSSADKAMGFEYIPDPGGDVGVVISTDVNKRIFLDQKFDIQLENTGALREKTIIDSLASRRDIFSTYITQKFRMSLSSKNPLINERKIGFCNSFWNDNEVCKIYKTTYFYSLCSGDLAMSMVCRDQGDTRRILVENRLLTSLIYSDNNFEMRSFEDSRKPVSLHGGVELIGVSKDYFLRVAVQGDHTQFSQGKKAPLGSGSMDWEDFIKSNSLKNLIKVSAAREFLEEWGKKHSIKENIIIENIVCIGFFRMPHRGGKPQFVVLCKFGNDNHQLRADASEVYLEEPENNDCLFRVRNLKELSGAVQTILENSDKRNSVPLLGAMSCLKDAIEFNPELISNALEYK